MVPWSIEWDDAADAAGLELDDAAAVAAGLLVDGLLDDDLLDDLDLTLMLADDVVRFVQCDMYCIYSYQCREYMDFSKGNYMDGMG